VLVIIQYIVMVSRIYKTNLYTAYKYNCEQCIDPPCLVKCSGQGGGFVSCSPKYIIKKKLMLYNRNNRDVWYDCDWDGRDVFNISGTSWYSVLFCLFQCFFLR
jgi:hypothetical protein